MKDVGARSQRWAKDRSSVNVNIISWEDMQKPRSKKPKNSSHMSYEVSIRFKRSAKKIFDGRALKANISPSFPKKQDGYFLVKQPYLLYKRSKSTSTSWKWILLFKSFKMICRSPRNSQRWRNGGHLKFSLQKFD